MFADSFQQGAYLVQQDVIENLAFELRQGHHVSIRGLAGSGKTALLNYIKRENPFGFERITMLNGLELSFDTSPLTRMLIGDGRMESELVLIDDFEDLVPESVQDMVLQIIEQGRKYGKIVVLANRKHMNRKAFDNNTRHVYLRGFSESELREYLGGFFPAFDEIKRFWAASKTLLSTQFTSPTILHSLSNVMQHKDFSIENFPKYIFQDINYQNAPIIEALRNSEIILPNAKEIIADIRVVNTRILDKIKRDPKAVYDLQPREFEKLVAELFIEKGYQVQLTQATRDGGKDIMIIDKSLGDFLIYAECKKFAPHRPVGVSIISDLAGRIDNDRATAGIVITTSYFSPEAQIFTRKIQHKMSLVDYLKLESWIKTGL
jgi:HJR/Mrr/RecB family endonuclease